MPGGPDPVDWQGRALDCTACADHAKLAEGLCGLGRSCVNDRYAKRIERFFVLNPEAADAGLDHPYFEARMNAARVASVFRLPKLIGDPDPGVRAMAVMRLPRPYAERAITDPDRRVRIAVVNRVAPKYLMPLTEDPDDYVRQVVARRAPDGLLPAMLHDPDPEVRRIVAGRVATAFLDRFRTDPDPLVRREAACRRPALFVADADVRVRHAVAEAGSPDELRALIDDPEDFIGETARMRLAALMEGA